MNAQIYNFSFEHSSTSILFVCEHPFRFCPPTPTHPPPFLAQRCHKYQNLMCWLICFCRDIMKGCCEKVTRQYDVSMKTYRKVSSIEDLPAICSRTATSPSIADTLEWLQISEQLLWQQYRCKEQLIKMFKLSDETSVEMFTEEWTVGDKNCLDQIQGLSICIAASKNTEQSLYNVNINRPCNR